MDEKMLWERFCEQGRIEDYLAYRRVADSTMKTELELSGKNNSTGACDTGTEYR